ncbi:WD40 repeat domain-containing protein [Paraburkholderia sp.]|uniref:WD40 repeat domain-containing protein n=1 Tax=Paraburkholderia sp. TaxID=1926495 RepID=UPI002D7E4634|nr:WD40 repeat domain-containing protein [Paraburkholderia sp.]
MDCSLSRPAAQPVDGLGGHLTMLNFADAAASVVHPFIGLRPFRIEDAAFFFGREQQIATLLHLVHNGSLVSVVGSSGSGKSSLVRAGLLPALTSAEAGERSWDWVEMRPGESPVRNLAEALARPNDGIGTTTSDSLAESKADRIEITLRSSSFGIGEVLRSTQPPERTRLLILVDQFEEIFRYANLRTRHNTNPTRASELRDEATFFVQLLLTAAVDENFSGAIVLTMRSDFIGDCARFHGLSEAVTRTQYLVPALTRDQRALAIRGPVERAGATIEPALVQQVLNDTSEDPDQLPVLQHAMMRCCQRAQDHDRPSPPAFTLERYNEIGGIDRALTQHGDELLEGLAQSDEAPGGLDLQYIAKRIFQSLTEIESQGRVIRRPQTIGDLVKVIARDDAPAEEVAAVEAAVRKVVAHFADPMCSFLRAPTEETLSAKAVVDIGHEALIRRWERLGGDDPSSWVREERADAEKYNKLVSFAELDALPSQLLLEFETWWQQRQPTRFWASRYTRGGEDRLDAAADLLARSRAEVARRRAEVVQRRSRRRKQVAGGIAIAGAVAILLAGVYINDMYMNREKDASTQANQIAAAGLNLLKRDSADQAALLARYALSHDDAQAPGARSTFENLKIWLGLENRANWLPIEPANMVLAYDALQHMEERAVFTVQKGMVGVAFRPMGKSHPSELLTVSWSDRGSPWAWDIEPIWNVHDDQNVRIRRLGELESADQLSAFQLSVNKTGDAILSGSTLGSDGVSLISTGDSKHWSRNDDIKVDGKRPRFGVFAPDRDLMLTGGSGTKWTMWELSRPDHGSTANAAFRPRNVFEFDDIGIASGYLTAAAISASGKYVAIATSGGEVRVYEGDGTPGGWSLAGEPLEPSDSRRDVCGKRYQDQNPGLPKNTLKWLMFDPSDPDRLIGAYDRADNIEVWDLASHKVTTLETCSNLPVFRGAISPDGKFVAATIQDQSRIYLWNMQSRDSGPGSRESPRLLRGSPDDGAFTSVAFDNQDHIAVGTSNGKVSLWYTEPVLSRDLPSAVPLASGGNACVPGSPDGTDVSTRPKDEGWMVTIDVKGVTAGKRPILVGADVTRSANAMTGTAGAATSIVSCKISNDGKWLLLRPSQGQLMLYDLRYPDSPVGLFGEPGAQWSDADFARGQDGKDMIVAHSNTHALRQWRFFRRKDDLIAFVEKWRPFISVSAGGSLEQMDLSDATEALLHGNFWPLMIASEMEVPTEHETDDKSHSGVTPVKLAR